MRRNIWHQLFTKHWTPWPPESSNQQCLTQQLDHERWSYAACYLKHCVKKRRKMMPFHFEMGVCKVVVCILCRLISMQNHQEMGNVSLQFKFNQGVWHCCSSGFVKVSVPRFRILTPEKSFLLEFVLAKQVIKWTSSTCVVIPPKCMIQKSQMFGWYGSETIKLSHQTEREKKRRGLEIHKFVSSSIAKSKCEGWFCNEHDIKFLLKYFPPQIQNSDKQLWLVKNTK